jgi:pseudaminic acid biosynthesis-associated methylase
MTDEAEAARLEGLWRGTFGDDYVRRNALLDERRGLFWADLLRGRDIASALEVGCGQGGNLRHLAAILPPEAVWGVDVNAEARARARVNAPGTNVVASLARVLPFRDGMFDLTMTVGVLIHQPDATLPLVMAELVRASRRYILWAEYHADETIEVPYHGQRGTLLKRSYGRIYHELFPEVEVVTEGFLGEEEGFDRVTWQLLRKR